MRMREIKFRVWSTANGTGEMRWLDPAKMRFSGQDLVEELDWKVMQFTGIRDRDGKEIYEGDIVRHCNGQTYPVEYSYGCFGLRGRIGAGDWHCFGTISADYAHCLVVGNVYENPELLEAK